MKKSVKSKKSKTHHNSHTNLNLQQNNYHLGSSEIDALSRMQDDHPELVDKIINLKQQEINMTDRVITIEENEQINRTKEAPWLRAYAFLGQFMAFSIAITTLVGASYFGYKGNNIIAGFFLTSTVSIGFAQFFNRNSKKESDSA